MTKTTRNLVGVLQQLHTELEQVKVTLRMNYSSGVALTIYNDMENLTQCLQYYLDLHNALVSDEEPMSEEDFPF